MQGARTSERLATTPTEDDARKIFHRHRGTRIVGPRALFRIANRRRETLRAVGKPAAEANRSVPIRAVCASPRPSTRPPRRSPQKFFSCARRRHVDFAACRKMRDNGVAGAHLAAGNNKPDVVETRIPSALLRYVDFCEQNHAGEKFLLGWCRRSLRGVSRAAAVGGSYAQKQLKSLLIFFCCSNPVSVPVDSRRHCTESPSTKLRRAAMAKKRKKAAAKKPAKKRRKKK
jgi:hypothetical protein